MSQKANVIRKALTRQGFVVDSVEWKPFQRGASQDEDTGGWKAETTCKGCGLHQTFGGLSKEEVLYTIETIACIVCQTLKIDIARLVATYAPIGVITPDPVDPELMKRVAGVTDNIRAGGSVRGDNGMIMYSREPEDDNFGPSTTYTRAPYKHWHQEPLLRPGLIDLLPDPTTLRCSSCKAECRPLDPSWRCTGSSYEHKCPESHPMAGYFAAEPIETPSEGEPDGSRQ